MRMTIHNGRAGKDGSYNPRHNDRNFDISHAEHIDPETFTGTGQTKTIYLLRMLKDCFMNSTAEPIWTQRTRAT